MAERMAAAAPACTAVAGSDRLSCPTSPVPPHADYGIHPLDPERRARMMQSVWRQGCPVSLDQLSLVVVPYVDNYGYAQRGEIVIATRYARDVEEVFRRLFEARFPIARMEPMENFDGEDQRSMAANNTSGFNCRPGLKPGQWSQHAYGDAIDVNPLWNPQFKDGHAVPPAAGPWLDRSNVRAGMAVRTGALVTAFKSRQWRWGGLWARPKDFQHFSVTGR